MENHAAFSTLVGFGACLGVYDVALSSARATGCALHGASLFFARAKKSKQKKARSFIRVRELRSRTSLLPPALRGSAYKGKSGVAYWTEHGKAKRSQQLLLQATRAGIPFRRPNAGVAQGDARHGRRARNEGAGMPLRDVPRSNAGVREVWSRSGQTRMQGAPSLWLLSLGETRESDAPCKAQPVARAEENATAHPKPPRHPASKDHQRPVPTPRRALLSPARTQSACA